MTRAHLVILLGLLTMLSPFLGLPYSWLMVLVPLLGLATIGCGIALRPKRPVLEARSAASVPVHTLDNP